LTALCYPVSRRSARRLGAFVLRMFRPRIYVTYGVLWALAVEGSAVLTGGMPGASGWSPSWRTVVRAGTVVLILLFMRMVDEQKDLGYDRVHHPDRPLVTGAITSAELRAAMAVIALAIVVANAAVSRLSAPLALAAPGYGLLLAVLERHCARIRDDLLLNLAVTYPVQVVVAGYVYLSLADCGTIRVGWRVLPLMVIFAGAFLQFEFARKTERHAQPGQRVYSSTVLGPAGSGLVALALGAVAAASALVLFRPWRVTGGAAVAAWLPYVALLFPAVGGWQFFVRRRPSWPALPAMGFIIVFYLALIVQALAIDQTLS
jgi:hypothetical protein